MHKKEKMLTIVLAILLIIFAVVIFYFNVLLPRSNQQTSTFVKPVVKEKVIQLNNTLKTSVTVMPAPEGTPVQP
jgi:hypothetical protein